MSDPENAVCTKEEVLTILREVMDPEIPALSVIDLGIIGDIEIKNERVSVKMIPTFTACPATRIIKQQITEGLNKAGFEEVEVEIDSSVPWNSDRITEEGKRKLKAFGLGAPLRHEGTFHLSDIEQSKCPHCGSINTTMNSMFGSTLCRSIHFCFDCRQGFERFKPL